MGEYSLSIADVERVLALNPRHFGALSGLAFMLEEMGEPELALKALQRGAGAQSEPPEHQRGGHAAGADERRSRALNVRDPRRADHAIRRRAARHGGPRPDQHRQDPLRDRAHARAPHRRHRPAAAAARPRGLRPHRRAARPVGGRARHRRGAHRAAARRLLGLHRRGDAGRHRRRLPRRRRDPALRRPRPRPRLHRPAAERPRPAGDAVPRRRDHARAIASLVHGAAA